MRFISSTFSAASFHVSSVAPSNVWPDWSRDLSPPLSALHLFTFRKTFKRFARLVRSSLPILSSRYLFCVSSVAPSNAWPDWSRDLSPPLSALHLFMFSSGEPSNVWPDWCGILSPSNHRANSFAFRAEHPQIGRDLTRIPTRPGTSVMCVFSCAACVARPSAPRPAGALASC